MASLKVSVAHVFLAGMCRTFVVVASRFYENLVVAFQATIFFSASVF